MTEEEILAMEAGAELDKLVAGELGDSFNCKYFGKLYHQFKDTSDEHGWSIPAPVSTDISAAWRIVEKLCNWDVDDNMLILKGQAPDLEPKDEEGKVGWWEAEINGTWGKVVAEGKTAPEAICKAVLLTKIGGN